MLDRLAIEVFYLVLELIPDQADVNSLSQVSKLLHRRTVPELYRSITFSAPDEKDLLELGVDSFLASGAREYLKYVKDLRFRTPFYRQLYTRCPHCRDATYFPYYGSEEEHDDEGDSFRELDRSDRMQPDAFLVHMASQLKPLLTLIKDDSLRSFSWDMGTRMPKSILSHISTKQASITSFSMTAAVHQWPDQGEASPYEAFRLAQLRKISWIADGNSHLFALRRLLSSSSGHLQEIVIDGKNFDPLQPFSTVSHNDDLAYKIPQETQGEREVLFPSLKKLSLSRVYLGNVRVPALPWLPPRWVAPVASLDEGDRADTVLAFNYFQLRSLKLEKCLRVDHLLSVLSGSSMSMELTSFELIVDSRVIPRHDHYRLGTCVEAFLESFEGLKNLYLDYSRLPNFFQAISRHKATLEKLVYQQREQYDNQFLWKKELSMLDLKCLGVGLKPSDLLPCLIQLVLGPKISEHTIYRPSVQLLHIRDGVQLTCKFKGPKRLEAEFPRALPEIYNFARWAFGPAGLPNLEILAYGDFAHQGRQPNILLCKSQLESDGETPYRQLTKKDVRLWEVVRENSDFLETCPETSLMY